MNNEQKIIQLEQRLWKLSSDIASAQHDLRMIQQEINFLKTQEDTEAVPLINKNTTLKERVDEIPQSPSVSFENFIGLKLIHLAGIILLVIGIAIGVKYAIDRELISEIMRITLAYIAGAVLWILSWRLRRKYAMFSAILFSGSMATFYFTTYAAFDYYSFFNGIAAFLIMVALTIYTVIEAIAYNRQEVAVLGMVGAYGIPFLISSNSGRFDFFFSYIFLINHGVIFLSFKKYWRAMAKAAMMITWTLFIGWELVEYNHGNKLIGILFLVLFYILFAINSLAFSLSKRQRLTLGEIQQIVMNNITLCIGTFIIYSDTLAIITGVLFIVVAVLTFLVLYFLKREEVLQSLMGWQSLLLLMLFIFFQYEGMTVTFLWIAVSVLLFAWGIFDKKLWFRLASVSVIGLTLFKLLLIDFLLFSTVQKIIAFIVMGVVLLVGSFYYQRKNLMNRNNSNN